MDLLPLVAVSLLSVGGIITAYFLGVKHGQRITAVAFLAKLDTVYTQSKQDPYAPVLHLYDPHKPGETRAYAPYPAPEEEQHV